MVELADTQDLGSCDLYRGGSSPPVRTTSFFKPLLGRELFVMNFERIKSDDMKHEYRVVFSSEEVEKRVDQSVENRAKTFKMQGFRAGHVPLSIVRSSLEVSILKDVLEDLIEEASKEIVKDLKVTDLASRPLYKYESQYEKGKDVVVTITVETTPQFDLKPFEMELKKIVPVVSDEELLETTNEIMNEFPFFEKTENDYVVKPGDKVSYSAKCFVNGIESKKKSFDEKVVLPFEIADDAEFLKGFVGKKVRESFDFVPATDKTVLYKIVIRSIKKRQQDLYWEEYSKRAGFDRPEIFSEYIRTGLESEMQGDAFLYHKHQILEYLSGSYDFELPQSVLNKETQGVLHSVKMDIEEERKKGTASEEDLKKTDEDLIKEYKDVIRKRVLLGYVLNKFARENKINASEAEIKNAILKEVNKYPQEGKAIIEYYTRNADALSYKKAEVIERKVIEFLVSKSKIVEEKMTKQQLKDLVASILEDDDK